MKTYSGLIQKLEPNQIFVFGSNTQGRHGAGAAQFAFKNFGAVYGQAQGRQGQSYAIVTKDLTKRLHPSITAENIIRQIQKLYEYALKNPELEFLVAYSAAGPNLNFYTSHEMAEMFYLAGEHFGGIPDNMVFQKEFARLMNIPIEREE